MSTQVLRVTEGPFKGKFIDARAGFTDDISKAHVVSAEEARKLQLENFRVVPLEIIDVGT